MYSRILVALDGSECSACGGRLALAAARTLGCELLACHVYGAELHSRRFGDMEEGLPAEYQQAEKLHELRDAHGSLILEGFRSLSQGYLEHYVTEARAAGASAQAVTAEGRNYEGILHLAGQRRADLIVLGAHGLGAIGDGLLGSTAAQVLRHACCDVLIARAAPADGAVLCGIDGSDAALAALRKAGVWARCLGGPVALAAAYDPQFHTAVFRAMGRSLSAQRQQEVGLAEQEDLHDKLINEGLAKLYQGFLDAAVGRAGAMGGRPSTHLLTGKPYRALVEAAEQTRADLLVVGRFGHHRRPISLLGTNAEAAVRMARGNVLVTAVPAAESAGDVERMDWDDDARARLQHVPPFARPMAQRAVEEAVRRAGGRRVSAEAFAEVARQFGMSDE